MAKSETRGATLGEINVLDMSGGVQARTTPALSNNNQLLFILNGVIDKVIGGIVGRCGSITTNATGKTLDNLGIYRNGDTRKYFITDTLGKVYTVPNSNFSGTLTEVHDFTDAESIFTTTFATKEMFFNGVDTPQQTADLTTFADITNAPVKGKYPAVFGQRLYALDIDSFLNFSDTVNATGDGFSSDSWANRGINPNDGQRPRGLYRHRGRLIIFKDESIYRYDGTNEPEAIINIGTHSERGVVMTDMELFFHSPTGIYKMGLGDPVDISRSVKKYLEGMDVANWDNVSAVRDDTHVNFWIGDVTIKDPLAWDFNETYSDVTLSYDFFLERWSVYTGWNALRWCRDTDTSTNYFFNSAGTIIKIDKDSYNDDGKSIDFRVRWYPMSYGRPQMRKTVSRIMIDGTPDLSLSAGENPKKMEWKGTLRPDNGNTNIIKTEMNFNKLWIMVNSTYDKSPSYIEQLSVGKCYARNKS